MAITNASDLLVYAKTTDPVKQKTRIRVLTTDPIEVPDGGTSGTVKINNLTDENGVVSDDISTAASTNTGSNVLAAINAVLTSATYDYVDDSGSDQTDGAYTYRDFENKSNGIVPTLEIVSGTATINENAIIIEVLTPGSSAIFDPVAFSTQASFSTNIDTIDCTNKDSGGFAQYKAGLKSFEISTELLQSINPDVPLDGTDFFDKLKTNSIVNLSFSDRIRNIIRTNLTQSGIDGFLLVTASQTNLQASPSDIGGNTASKIQNTSTSLNRLQYSVSPGRLEDKNVTWTFYAKGVGSNTSISFFTERSGGTSIAPSEVKVLSGTHTSITSPGTASRAVNGLDTSTFTRIQVTYNNFDATGGQPINFMVFPGGNPSTQTIGDAVIVSSWQIEFSPEATNYQDPTDITHWQGNALVSSLSFDAGVEDNLTCSATFTGTDQIFLNGLGPELIGDTEFNNSNYWGNFGGSEVSDGYGKIIAGSTGTSGLNVLGLVSSGSFYKLTYTIPSASPGTGSIKITDVDAATGFVIPSSVGTHTVTYKAGDNDFEIVRGSNPTNIFISSISLKKVL
mgnify:CR=1 FL=1